MTSQLASVASAFLSNRPREYTIGDLAREFGVTLRALRFYEARGLLTPRREGLARFYSSRDRTRLSMILKAKQLGFTLSEIKAIVSDPLRPEESETIRLSSDELEEQIAHLERQLAEIEAALTELRDMRRELVRAA
jgi:DNA-binding transcriptional MerR regulator